MVSGSCALLILDLIGGGALAAALIYVIIRRRLSARWLRGVDTSVTGA
jgi:hypothetical protein